MLDGISYFIFCGVLTRISLRPDDAPVDSQTELRDYRLADAVRLLLRNPILRSTTLMFMAFNAGEGLLQVWLPIHARTLAGGNGVQLYGTLLALIALGETIGALCAPRISTCSSEGRLICLAQSVTGLSLCLALIGPNLWTTVPALLLLGGCSAPLTAWAQTLRMRVIPPRLRGRSFALLRTLMQASGPAFSGIGGPLFGLIGLHGMISLSAASITVPGIVGARVHELVGIRSVTSSR